MSKQVSQLVITFLLALIVMTLMLMACTPTTAVTPAAALPTSTARPTGAAPTAQPTEQPVVVAFVKDGDIKLWDEATNQSETIFTADDVIAVTMSDDGQVIAFLRRRVVEQTDGNWFEQSALWAVGRNGENPRELVAAENLRQRLNAAEGDSTTVADSTTIAQIDWIPQTHRLVYSGIRYIAQGEGTSHARPEGVYLVDTDTLSNTVLTPAGNNLRFVPSPDGQQIALMSTTGLSFINVDGSNRRQDVLTYPQVGVPLPLLPNGVWTQDGRAFVMVAPIESESESVLNYTSWRVPADGLPAQPLATITDSHSGSVTFSPDGHHAAFYRWQPKPAWFITPLTGDVGPLAIPSAIDELGYANLHWSPAGAAFVFPSDFAGFLFQLCTGATQNSEVCGDPVHLGGTIAAIHWIDSSRFLFLTRDPYALLLGRLDGTTIPIVTWLPEESASSQSFTTVSMAHQR